ncbi:MarR family winged helix-turn-helix transcriptional regulator [Thalassotalea euphylliae]|uniref:MarR family winged helix-turn-helix transcriptional regulator n=1 Tax=Thalassotalea euphylliae TaxID=1655234 RepID=UPI00363FB553
MSENLKLEKQLCFRVYNLNKTITKLYAPLLKDIGLTYPQYLVMLVLWEANDGVPIKFLSEKLDLDTGTLSPLLKRMEAAQLIKRQRSEDDERSVTIALSAHGRHIKQKARHIPGKLYSLTGMKVDELASLQHTLDKLMSNAKSHLN